MTTGFDTYQYIKEEKDRIKEAIDKHEKIVFEFGGKLLDDWHAARVLPGFMPDTKLRLFSELKDQIQLIVCINSENIEKGRIRSDYNNLYTSDCIRLIHEYRNLGFKVSGIAFTVFRDQPKAIEFADILKDKGEKVYFLKYIPNYPNDYQAIIDAFNQSDYIETNEPICMFVSSGSASGKLSACLCQFYNQVKRGHNVRYIKFDIFPTWDLAINHPINLAFMAATADSKDEIVVDTYYFDKYHKKVSNYNRDLNVFPVIKKILGDLYDSPTEMVVNCMTQGITDMAVVEKAAKAEVCRRFYTYMKQVARGMSPMDPVWRVLEIMEKNNISIEKDYPIISCGYEIEGEACIIEECDGQMLVIPREKGMSITESINKVLGEKAKSQIFCNLHANYLLSIEEERKLKEMGFFVTCDPF